MTAATREEHPDTANWEQGVEIPQMAFGDSRLHTEWMWQTVVLIPKGNGEFIGIIIVEFLWKDFSGVINQRIRSKVQFNGVLHGFGAGWRTGNASLESKLLQKLTEMREEVL